MAFIYEIKTDYRIDGLSLCTWFVFYKGIYFVAVVNRGNCTHRCAGNHVFILTIKVKKLVAHIKVKADYCTGAKLCCFAGEIKILTNMTNIHKAAQHSTFAITPFGTVWHN